MSRYRLAAAALCVVSLVLVSGCGGGVSQREVLAGLTDHVITPRFEAAAAWAVALDATVSTLTTQPRGEALDDAREAWRSARGAWSRTAAMWFGPVMERRSGPLMSWWPIDPELIETTLASATRSAPGTCGTASHRRSAGSTRSSTCSFRTTTSCCGSSARASSRFGEYLRSLTAVIAEETAGVRDAWRGADGDQFAGRGDRVIAESLAIADLVRVTIFLTATAEAAQTGQADPAARGARPGWSRSTDASGASAGADRAGRRAVQIVVPLRHQLYPGSVRWNEEGYRFGWRVLLTEKVGSVEYRVTDPSDGRTWLVDPAMYLSALQAERMTTQPDLILATAQIIRDDYAAQGRDVEVRADAFVAVNGRPYARLIDPEIDLARERQGVGAKRWILPEP